MKPAKPQYPYIDENGNEHYDQIKHYSVEGYKIIQNETGEKYNEAVDPYPCRYTYSETTEPIKVETDEVNNE